MSAGGADATQTSTLNLDSCDSWVPAGRAPSGRRPLRQDESMTGEGRIGSGDQSNVATAVNPGAAAQRLAEGDVVQNAIVLVLRQRFLCLAGSCASSDDLSATARRPSRTWRLAEGALETRLRPERGRRRDEIADLAERLGDEAKGKRAPTAKWTR
jgi:hypothetical protein